MTLAEEWLDLIGAEANLPEQDECPGCDGGPCMWATNVYPLPADGLSRSARKAAQTLDLSTEGNPTP